MTSFAAVFRFSLVLVAALALTACAPSGGKAPAAGSVDALQALSTAVKSRRSGDSIVAEGDMKIFDRQSDFSLGMAIENFAAVYPDKMRLKTTKLAGNVEVFDALMRGDNIAFYVPRHKTLYTGKVSELNGGGLSFSPELIVARLLKGDGALLEKQWKSITPAVRRGEKTRSTDAELEQIHRPGENFLRVRLDTRRQVITRIAYLDGQGREYMVEDYDNYREMGGTPEAPAYFPTRFGLTWPDKDRYVKINLKNVDLSRSPESLAEAFSGIDNLDMDKVQRKNLGQARVEGDTGGTAAVTPPARAETPTAPRTARVEYSRGNMPQAGTTYTPPAPGTAGASTPLYTTDSRGVKTLNY